MVMAKDKKYIIEDTISIKISLMHYMKWTRLMSPVALEKFRVVYIFLLVFFFSLPIGK